MTGRQYSDNPNIQPQMYFNFWSAPEISKILFPQIFGGVVAMPAMFDCYFF